MMQAVTLSKVCVLLVVVLAGACDAAKTVQHVLLIRYVRTKYAFIISIHARTHACMRAGMHASVYVVVRVAGSINDDITCSSSPIHPRVRAHNRGIAQAYIFESILEYYTFPRSAFVHASVCVSRIP